MDLAGTCDKTDLREQLAAMVQHGEFGDKEAAVLDVEAIARFWAGEVGRAILGERMNIRREEPFTARFSMGELEQLAGVPKAADLEGEFVVVQGVADLLVVKESELWLLDFKTDEAARGDLADKAALYRPQISLYAAALEAIHGRPVTRRWLHFLRAGETIVL